MAVVALMAMRHLVAILPGVFVVVARHLDFTCKPNPKGQSAYPIFRACTMNLFGALPTK